MKVINFWGSPCAGKSTTAEGFSYYLKSKGHKCQLTQEVPKELTYEENWSRLRNQILITGEQSQRLAIRKGHTDLIVSDSPLPLSLLYTPPDYFKYYTPLVWEVFHSYDNVNFLLETKEDYDPKGRSQTKEEALAIQERVVKLLKENHISYYDLTAVSRENILETAYKLLQGHL
jgi:hypothetical protein